MDKIEIVRSVRSSIGIRIMPDGSIKVSAPFFVTRSQIDRLLESKKNWIRQSQQRLLLRTPKKAADEYLYLGKTYQVVSRSNKTNVVELEDKLYVASTNEN
jgi:predicted metal-dependent hydrolase